MNNEARPLRTALYWTTAVFVGTAIVILAAQNLLLRREITRCRKMLGETTRRARITKPGDTQTLPTGAPIADFPMKDEAGRTVLLTTAIRDYEAIFVLDPSCEACIEEAQSIAAALKAQPSLRVAGATGSSPEQCQRLFAGSGVRVPMFYFDQLSVFRRSPQLQFVPLLLTVDHSGRVVSSKTRITEFIARKRGGIK